MVYAGIREIKAHLSHYLREAKQGRSVAITDRGTVIARLVPVQEDPAVEALESLAQASTVTLPADLTASPPQPLTATGTPLSRIIIESRR